MPDLGVFYGQNNGCGAGISLWYAVEVSDIREAPDGGNAHFWGAFPALCIAVAVVSVKIKTSAARFDFPL